MFRIVTPALADVVWNIEGYGIIWSRLSCRTSGGDPRVSNTGHQPTFTARIDARSTSIDSLVCIGLDPVRGRMPEGMPDTAEGVFDFCRDIVDATADHALAFKPNLGFFLAYGVDGLDALFQLRDHIPPTIPVILDCKVGDIGSTSQAYATAWFDELHVDAITVHPYLGEDAIAPFLNREGKGVFVLAKTSNPGSGDLQDLMITATELPVYLHIAKRAAAWETDYPASVGLVVGATWPEHLRRVRAAAPTLPILLPGVGTQHGDVAASLRAGLVSDGTGLLCSSSRGIMYASSGKDFSEAARREASRLQAQINSVRTNVSATVVDNRTN